MKNDHQSDRSRPKAEGTSNYFHHLIKVCLHLFVRFQGMYDRHYKIGFATFMIASIKD